MRCAGLPGWLLCALLALAARAPLASAAPRTRSSSPGVVSPRTERATVRAVTRDMGTTMTPKRVNPRRLPLDAPAVLVPAGDAPGALPPASTGWTYLNNLSPAARHSVVFFGVLGFAGVMLSFAVPTIDTWMYGSCPEGEAVVLKYNASSVIDPSFARRWITSVQRDVRRECQPRVPCDYAAHVFHATRGTSNKIEYGNLSRPLTFIQHKLRKAAAEECKKKAKELTTAVAQACFRRQDDGSDEQLLHIEFSFWLDCLELPTSCHAPLCS